MKIKIGILLIIVFSLVLAGCGKQGGGDEAEKINKEGKIVQKETNGEPKEEDKKINEEEIDISEIAKHGVSDDCWLLINGKVYDVTKYISSHPAGKTILDGCGKDATELYKTRPMGSKTPHSEKADKKLEEYYIGKVIY